jgi:hypothetical protein
MTLKAFADTVVPGEKRWDGDRTVGGAASGGGAMAARAVPLLEVPEGGLAPALDMLAHLHTADAVAAGHPGLATIGFAGPGADGRWGFPDHPYGRPLARAYPATTASRSLS